MAGAVSLRAIVRGRVQGVFFRGFTVGCARKLGLDGSVRNLPDGTVEVCAEGDREVLERLVGCLKEGPPAARVDGVAAAWSEAIGRYDDFSARY